MCEMNLRPRPTATVRLPRAERERLYAFAAAQGLSVSEILKTALRRTFPEINLQVNRKVEYVPQSPQHGWRRKERLATGRFVQDAGSAQNPASDPPKPKDEGFKD